MARWFLEQCERNGGALSHVSCIIDMQVVAAVIAGEQSRRVARVSHHRVEIDHGIEFSPAANPGVELEAHAFFLGRRKADQRRRKDRTFERWNGRPKDSNTFLMRARDELTIPGDQTLDAHTLRQRYEGAWEENVIDA